jgi:hypothetical protein
MDIVPAANTDLTDDPIALAILSDESLALLEPDDPYHQEAMRLTSQIAAFRRRIPAKRLNIVDEVLRGTPKTEIISAQRTSYATINNTLESRDVQDYVYAKLRLTHLRKGPAIEARAAMLWRIALREEIDRPAISIKAVDTLNKQEGLYRPEEQQADAGLVVNINQFVVNNQGTANATHTTHTNSTAPNTIEHDAHPEAEDASFTPVTVEIPTP